VAELRHLKQCREPDSDIYEDTKLGAEENAPLNRVAAAKMLGSVARLPMIKEPLNP